MVPMTPVVSTMKTIAVTGSYDEPRDGDYIPSGSKKYKEGMRQGMFDAMEEMNLRLMNFFEITPEETAAKLQNNGMRAVREREGSRMKVLE